MKKIILVVFLSLILTGCSDIQIFEEKKDPNSLTAQKDSTLKNDTYYVKDGTNFYKVHLPKEGNASSEVTSLDENRVFACLNDESLIPTLYQGEFLALQSEKLDKETTTLERFKDYGYSIGCFGGYITEDGFLYFDKDQGLVKDSSLYESIGETNAKDIRISSINGNPLKKEQINENAGIITGFSKDEEVTVGYFVGTRFFENNIKADCKMYGAFELFQLGKECIIDTPNGYRGIEVPSDFKSGYYNINGSGLFLYLNCHKEYAEKEKIDINDSYYGNEKSKIEAFSRQYQFQVPNRVKNLRIKVEVNSDNAPVNNESVKGIAFSPDGTKMDMVLEKNALILSLSEAMAGDWTINIIPKTLEVANISIENDTIAEEATCKETIITLDSDMENALFQAEFFSYDTENRDYTVYGSIIFENGSTTDMDVIIDDTDRNHPTFFISGEIPYAKKGSYKVRIYHYPEETSVLEPTLTDHTSTDEEIIVIEG